MQRQLRLPGWGAKEQARLAEARIVVIGMGGLGCPIAQQLIAAGVQLLRIVDPDEVALSNLHRQVLYGVDDIGRLKVDVARERLKAMAPLAEIDAVSCEITADNAEALLADATLVIDGTDTFAAKYLIADACELTSTPLVWGTVLRHGGQVALWHSGPAAANGRGVGLRDLFPAPPTGEHLPDCASAGVFGVTTSIIGGLMASLALGMSSSELATPVGQVTAYDAFPARMRSWRVNADPQRELVSELSAHVANDKESSLAAAYAAVAALRSGAGLLIDLREPEEIALEPLPAGVPHVERPQHLDPLDAQELWVMCAGGVRSAAYVQRRTDPRLRDVQGGYPVFTRAWAQQP